LIALTIGLGLLVNEVYAWLPTLARVILEFAAGLLPSEDRERYAEEWLAEWECHRRHGRGLYMVAWSLSLVPWAAVRRLGDRFGILVGSSLVPLGMGTTLFATHDPSSASVGGKALAWAFAAAVIVLASALFADPRLERPWLVGTGAFLLGLAVTGEALLLRLPSESVTLWIRVGLVFIAPGLFAIGIWSLTHGRAKRWFCAGIVMIAVGATIAGLAECQAARLLSGSDGLWSGSSWLSGAGALLAAATAPMLLKVVNGVGPTPANT